MAGRAHMTVSVEADLTPFNAQLRQIASRGVSLGRLDTSNFVPALGRITGKASEFNKSLEASHARVLAFSASAGAIYAIKRSFEATLGSMIQVESVLTDINSLLGLSKDGLASFGSDLFRVASNTASSFRDAALAATEFSRQGLGVEETLARTNAALGITRLSGLELKDSISAVTSTLSSFSREAITAEQLVDKLATVDARFAVSSGDLAQSLKRVGSSAQDANVSLDEMLAITAAVQQKTARGGAIIGNAFKTIFTRLQRPQVLDHLEELGFRVRTASGEILPMMNILQDLAQRYDQLTPSLRSQTSELIGGVFQINVLKAAMSDLKNGVSNYTSALDAAQNSTGEFRRRNEELNQTLQSKLNQTLNESVQTFSQIGNITIGSGLSKIVSEIRSSLQGFNEILSPKMLSDGTKDYQGVGGEIGHNIVTGILGAMGNVLAGPGVQLIAMIFTKIAADFLQFFQQAGANFMGVHTNAEKYKVIEMEIHDILIKRQDIYAKIVAGEMSVGKAGSLILNELKQRKAMLEDIERLTARIAMEARAGGVNNLFYTKGQNGGRAGRATGFFPSGFNAEEAMAKALGASDSVKAHVSRGTIGGQRFVMNNEEIEIPGFGANGDSAVIPTYGASGFADGYSPSGGSGAGDNFLLSATLGMLSSSFTRASLLVDEGTREYKKMVANLQSFKTVSDESIKLAKEETAAKKDALESQQKIVGTLRKKLKTEEEAGKAREDSINATAEGRMSQAAIDRNSQNLSNRNKMRAVSNDIERKKDSIDQLRKGPDGRFRKFDDLDQGTKDQINNVKQEIKNSETKLADLKKNEVKIEAAYQTQVKTVTQQKLGALKIQRDLNNQALNPIRASIAASNRIADSLKRTYESTLKAEKAAQTQANVAINKAQGGIAKQENANKRTQDRRQAVQSSAIAASIGISAIAGAMPEGPMKDFTQSLATAAQVVSALPGPLGYAAAGGLAIYQGGLAIRRMAYSTAERQKAELDVLKGQTSRVTSALNEYVQSIAELQNSYFDNSVTTDMLSKMQLKAAKNLAQVSRVSPELGGKLAAAVTDKDKERVANEFTQQQNNALKKKEREVELNDRFEKADERNFITRFATPGGADNASSFNSTNIFGYRSKSQKYRDDSALSEFTTETVGSLSQDQLAKSIAVLSGKGQKKSGSEKLQDLLGAGVIDRDAYDRLTGDAEAFTAELQKQTFETMAIKKAQELLNVVREKDIQTVSGLNNELSVAQNNQRAVVSEIDASINRFTKGLATAKSLMEKLKTGATDVAFEVSKGKEELLSQSVGAQTMNRIKFGRQREEVLTQTSSKIRERTSDTNSKAAQAIFESALGKSDSVFKTARGEGVISKESLFAKEQLGKILQEQMSSGASPNEMLASFQKMAQNIALPASNKGGGWFLSAEERKLSRTEQDKILSEKSGLLQGQLKLGFSDVDTKKKLEEMIDALHTGNEEDKTSAKMQLDKLNAQEKAQRDLIEIQRNTRMFGNLPANKQEQRDLERQIKKDSRASLRGDDFATNRLVKLTAEQFGDSLTDSNVSALKARAVAGEARRGRRIVDTFESGGAVTGLSGQFSDSRLNKIATDKVNAALKTEKSGLKLPSGLDGDIIKSNQALSNELKNLSATLVKTFEKGFKLGDNTFAAAADADKKVADKMAETRAKKEELNLQRQEDFKNMKNAFSEALKAGFNTDINGNLALNLQNFPKNISEEIADLVKESLTAEIKSQIGYKFGQSKGEPSKVSP